ncbi:MAG TPA: hypothetical protein ENI00_08785 [Marinobacter antarcticus]|uniref:Uncharacterized protein n=1 Tax=Marinobacter antarcticus TaxID=564117 RepID=A0A831R582_9GAMM|nr:hypothetical protein [Marinobacter antarcticus]
MLWVLCFGYYALGTMLWVLCFGYYALSIKHRRLLRSLSSNVTKGEGRCKLPIGPETSLKHTLLPGY